MNTYLINVEKEFYKLKSRKKYFVFLIIAAVVVAVRALGTVLIAKLTDGSVTLNGNIALEMLRFLAEILVPIIIFMAAADLFSTQMREDTLKADLIRPVTRLKLLLAKVTAIMLMSALYFGVFFIVCVITQLITGSSFRFVPYSLLAYLLDLIPLINIALMAVLINLIAASPSMAMVLCLAVYVVMKYFSYYVSGVGQMLFTSYALWHNLWIGSIMPFSAMIGKLGILFGSMLILFSVSYIIFDRKDI